MSSRWIRSSSSTSPSHSRICVSRGVPFEGLRLARRREGVAGAFQLVLDDREDAGAGAQDVEVVGDLGRELRQLVADLVAAERGQPLQAQIEDGAGLRLGQAIGVVG